MLTLPNIITLARLALVPPIVALSLLGSGSALLGAWVLFNLDALSDALDGYIARHRDCTSRMGTLLDPVVDKVLILSVLFVFSDAGLLPVWLVLLLMAREFLVSAVRHARTTSRRVEGANWMGKTKFCFQVLVAQVGYAHLVFAAFGRGFAWGGPLTYGLMALTTALAWAFVFNFIRWYGIGGIFEEEPDGDEAV